MKTALHILLTFALALTASAQTFSTGDYQINRKKSTAGFEVAELLAGSNITITWNNSNKTATIAGTATTTPGGSTTQVQFNDGGAFGGNNKFTFNKTSGDLSLGAGLIIGDLTNGGGSVGMWDSANEEYKYITFSSGEWSFTGANGINATKFTGSGASLTTLNASQLTTGTVPAARLSLESIRTVSTSTAAASTDRTILVDASAGSVTLTLPAVASSNELRLNIKALTTNAGANTITIDPNGTETIDGSAASLTTTTAYTSWQLHCNGSAWYLIK